MSFEKYSTEQLKKFIPILMITIIVGLAIMCFLLGMGLYHSTHNIKSSFIFYVPLLGPFAILPAVFIGTLDKELKKRN